MTVAEMLERMSSRELSEWMAYYRMEPFGGYPEDVRMAIISATVANANRGQKSRALKPADFMPDWAGEKRMDSPAALLAKVEVLNAALGGVDLRR